jgi:hypothetical protein
VTGLEPATFDETGVLLNVTHPASAAEVVIIAALAVLAIAMA